MEHGPGRTFEIGLVTFWSSSDQVRRLKTAYDDKFFPPYFFRDWLNWLEMNGNLEWTGYELHQPRLQQQQRDEIDNEDNNDDNDNQDNDTAKFSEKQLYKR